GVEDSDGADATDGSDSEHEYAVGHRMEQTLSTPGSIKRITVAVALQGAPSELSAEVVEQLVTNAVGIDRSRGDAVSVLLLPAAMLSSRIPRPAETVPAALVNRPATTLQPGDVEPPRGRVAFVATGGALLLAVAAILGVTVLRRESGPAHGAGKESDVDIEATAAKVRQWLNETPPPVNAGAHSGRG
ncbi:MAG TPA: flagellar M-ring protein FliF C-terminal domain-containing protein, partial [Steroidobacteraceae bacterium]